MVYSNAQTTRARLISLFGPGLTTEDPDELRPTAYAAYATDRLLYNAIISMGDDFPRGAPTLDGVGGIYIYWHAEGTKPRRMVQLLIPPTPDAVHMIFWIRGKDDYGHTSEVTAEELVKTLRSIILEKGEAT